VGSIGGRKYPDGYQTTMLRGPYDLSTATGATQLQADMWLKTEARYDKATLYASIDGIHFDGNAYSGQYPWWSRVMLDLNQVQGADGVSHDWSHSSSVWIRIDFTSDASNTDEGVYFDDIRLQEVGLPTITSLGPDDLPAGTNSYVTINGSGFGSTQGYVAFPYGRDYPFMSSDKILSWTDTQIMCVVPAYSIGNYPGSAGSGPVYVLTSSGYKSNEYVYHVPFGYGGHKWANWGARFYVNTTATNRAARLAAIDAAAATWNRAGSAFRFTDAGRITWPASDDGRNEITWASGLPDGIIGWSTSIWDETGNLAESDIEFNNAYAWGDGSPGSGTMDTQSIATHELGHWLRLLDQYGPSDADKVMYGFGDTNQQKRSLSAGDIAGIRWIYPRVAPKVSRGPAKPKVTYTRRNGVARFLLSATVRAPGGGRWPGIRVYLQASDDGITHWKNVGGRNADRLGRIAFAMAARKKGTTYYRWYAPASSRILPFATGRQKVVVR
jgi:hypothetical protein